MDVACSASFLFISSSSLLSPSSVVPELLEAVKILPGLAVQLQGRLLRFGAMPQEKTH